MALSPDFLSASSILYCEEDVASWGDDVAAEWAPPSPSGGPPIAALLAVEAEFLPVEDYLPRLLARSLDPTARQDAINWILKVNEFYRFRPVTACLAVSYLDRFLAANSLPAAGGGWAMQLLSVACVSVAAKMEETHVPLLLDLQILDPRFVFDPRTVRRMELLLMTSLRWRMRAVTPFDFLDPFLYAAFPAAHRTAVLSRAAHLVLSTHRVVDFLTFRPSAVAAAAVVCAAREIADSSAGNDAVSLAGLDDWVSKDVLWGCCQLMEEYLIDTCPSAKSGLEPPVPQSPVGVLDAAACGSCDTQKSAVLPEDHPVPAVAPPTKRRRVGGGENSCTASIDTVDE